MKIIGTFGVVVIASIALMQTAEGRPRGGGGRSFGGGFSSGHSFSSGSRSYAPRSYSSSYARSYESGPALFFATIVPIPGLLSCQLIPAFLVAGGVAQQVSSGAERGCPHRRLQPKGPLRLECARTPTDVARKARFDSNARSAPTRMAALRAQGLVDKGGRVDARQTRNWNRNRDHNWNGNRCRWRNNCWVVIGSWYPWWGYGYGYYPYASYSYYDSGYYDDRYYDDGYAQYDEGSRRRQRQRHPIGPGPGRILRWGD